MRRDDYIEILRQHPYYSKKFNNSKELIKFPSSFGICYDQNKMWVFYEVDERQEVTKNFFNNEADAFEFAFKKYGLNSSLMFEKSSTSQLNVHTDRSVSLNQSFISKKENTIRRIPDVRASRKKVQRNVVTKSQRKKP